MGLYDRDYYRNDPPGGRLWGGVAPVCKYLIAINVAVFLLQVFTQEPRSLRSTGVTAWLELSPEQVVDDWQLWRVVTYAFCHNTKDPMHILFNMLGLWWFGSQVEPIYGQREFLRFYLTAAFLSGVGFLLFQLATGYSGVAVGASGAVMAVLMLCAMYYPAMKVLVMFVLPIQLRWLVVLFVIYDMWPVVEALRGVAPADNVAHSAHLAGLLYGFLYKRFDLRYGRLAAGWSWPKLKRVVRSATTRKPDSVRLYQPEEEHAPTPELNRRVDEILAKISTQGESSLTETERDILKEASRRYKKR